MSEEKNTAIVPVHNQRDSSNAQPSWLQAEINEEYEYGAIYATSEQEGIKLEGFAQKHHLPYYRDRGGFGFGYIQTNMETARRVSRDLGLTPTTKLTPGPENGLGDGKSVTINSVFVDKSHE